MKGFTRWTTVALLLLAVFLLACEGESPTIPEPGVGPGQQPPPQPTGQISIALSVSNPNPLVNSTSTITATVTQDGQNVPEGTAVEFSTNLGSFTENNSQSILRVTTNGVATVTLTSATPGAATVTVRVAAATRTTSVTFRAESITPPPPETAPSVTGISPSKGIPAGGELVNITGKNFQSPVRVLFGDRAATVISVTPTQIQVLTPSVEFTANEQTRDVNVKVIVQAGTPDEKSAPETPKFTYELQILQPAVQTVNPSHGPNEGNTRISIMGVGFQPPTKVFFVSAVTVELDVISINPNLIVAMTPPALGLATSFRDSAVTLRVLNVNTGKEATLSNAFQYGPAMKINTVTPITGTALGGTRLTISGWGFDDPVVVLVAGVLAQPVQVTGTQIVAVTGQLLNPCASVEGDVVVTNVEDGATATFSDPGFAYIGTLPIIISVTPNPVTATQPPAPPPTVTIVVRNAGAGIIRFQIGTFTLLPTPASATDPQGDSAFVVTLPQNIPFATEPCVDAAGRPGERFVPTVFDVTFTNITTDCTDTLGGGLTVNPTDLSCRVPPDAVIPASMTFTGPCGTPSADQNYTVANAGGSSLTITGITGSIPGTTFEIRSGPAFPATIPAGGAPLTWVVGVNPLVGGPPPATPVTGTVTVSSNDPTPPTPTSVTVSCAP